MRTFLAQVHNLGDRMQVNCHDTDGIMGTGDCLQLHYCHTDVWRKETIIMEKKKGINEENTKVQEAEELDLDDLDSVAGGYSLRDAKKEKTTDISSGTIGAV